MALKSKKVTDTSKSLRFQKTQMFSQMIDQKEHKNNWYKFEPATWCYKHHSNIQALMLWQKTCYLRSHRLTESDFWWPKLVCCKATASLFFIGHQPSSYQKYPIRKYDICGIEITCIHHNRRWRGSLGKSCRALVFCAWKKGKNYIQRFYWIYLILIVLIFSWYVCKTVGTTSVKIDTLHCPFSPDKSARLTIRVLLVLVSDCIVSVCICQTEVKQNKYWDGHAV